MDILVAVWCGMMLEICMWCMVFLRSIETPKHKHVIMMSTLHYSGEDVISTDRAQLRIFLLLYLLLLFLGLSKITIRISRK